ncbi:peptidoglycan D,D-transpeptidase FtsI family protein [Actomonas aquatica]|uniref:Penicillin-binding protein 2 n=1 Tax=Actomonas aquatica TaxID=2866162 RepID=A0ABZ1CES9_9BACT|nr:penicillin-binding protein 2 [Opitutus sp. WL0086]WRQ89109.1 penicillin-binding protein 2 [Opitutus sp. WL0086]
MSKGFASSYRLVLIATGVLLCFVAVGARLVSLHVLERAHLVTYVDQARYDMEREHGRRGDILDARGDVLATSRPLVQLAVDAWYVPEYLEHIGKNNPGRAVERESIERQKRRELADILDIPYAELEAFWQPEKRNTSDGRTIPVRWRKLHDGVDESVFDRIMAINVGDRTKALNEVPRAYKGLPLGLTFKRRYERYYPRKQLAAHVLGFVNKENVPFGGIEAHADDYLRAYDGWWESEKDGRRREMAHLRVRDVPPEDGLNVQLSIDSAVQHLIESELAYIAQTYEPKKASIIVSDAQTGFILGLANYPTYNLNDYGSATEDQQRNVAITDQLDPGSTFKIVAASGALEAGLVNPGTRFNCSIDSIEYKGRVRRFIPDDHANTHPLSVAEIISHSSNIGAAQLGMLLGEQGLYDTAHKFGFGEKTGLPLGYESPGLLNHPDKWSAVEITRIPAGYSISATPMQIHYGMATIASGGELLKPQVVRAILDENGEPIFRFDRSARRRVISPETAAEMAQMLMGVASDEGTAKKAEIPGYEVAGKTGTAQKLIDGKYSKRHHIGSFSGFFPASDPRVVVTVIVDDAVIRSPYNPSRRMINYGSQVAVPAFARVARGLISYLDIQPATGPTRTSPRYAIQGGRR